MLQPGSFQVARTLQSMQECSRKSRDPLNACPFPPGLSIHIYMYPVSRIDIVASRRRTRPAVESHVVTEHKMPVVLDLNLGNIIYILAPNAAKAAGLPPPFPPAPHSVCGPAAPHPPIPPPLPNRPNGSRPQSSVSWVAVRGR